MNTICWGNINYLSIWGNSPILLTEGLMFNKGFDLNGDVITSYNVNCECLIGGTMHSYTFKYDPEIAIGNYMLNKLPNYTLQNNRLILTPEPLYIIPEFSYAEIPYPKLKLIHFKTELEANKFINVFDADFLFNGKIIKKVSEKDFIEYWNNSEIENPVVIKTLINYCITNYYYCKRYLNVKAFLDIPINITGVKVDDNPNINDYIYIYTKKFNGENKIICSKTKPKYYEFGLSVFGKSKHRTLKNLLFKGTITPVLDKPLNMITVNYKGITIFTPLTKSTRQYICVYNNTLCYKPKNTKPIPMYTVVGYVNNMTYITYNNFTVKCDLYILMSRAKRFSRAIDYINTHVEIVVYHDIYNLLCFAFSCNCNITNYHKEYKIAEYYEFSEYKEYILNWLKVNDPVAYYFYSGKYLKYEKK